MRPQLEEHVVRAAMAGDEEALGRLWLHHRRFVATILLAYKPAQEDLDDLLQEVAVAIVRGIAELQDPARVCGWLRTLAIHIARGAGRRESRRRRWLRPLGTTTEASDEGAGHGEDSTAGRLAEVLQQARALPADYREPLLLRCLEGWSQKRIATALQLPESTIENRLARARRMLRERLEEQNAKAVTSESAMQRTIPPTESTWQRTGS